MSLYSIFRKSDKPFVEGECVYGTDLRDGIFVNWMWYPTKKQYEAFMWHVLKLEPDYEKIDFSEKA